MPEYNQRDLFKDLKNHDIETLFEIVEAAERANPNAPYTSTVHAALEKYAKDNHMPARDVDRYTDFFFYLARPSIRAGTSSLFEAFRKLLANNGIIVSKRDEPEDDATVEIDSEELESAIEAERQSTRQLSRRASFSSVYDILPHGTDGTVEEPPPAYSSFESRNKRSTSVGTDPGHERPVPRAGNSGLLAQPPIRGRRNGRFMSEQLPVRRNRSLSVASRGSLRIDRRNGNLAMSQRDDATTTEESLEDGTLADNIDTRDGLLNGTPMPARPPIPAPQIYQPSDTTMFGDADAFLLRHTRTTARRLLHQWHDSAIRLGQHHEDLERAATAYDRGGLIGSAFRLWADRFQAVRSERHNERLSAQRGERATRLYNEHIKYKSFTHWARHAADQIQRTDVARRHLLRMKYFNAWRDNTAVNELKVRQFALNKFFSVWRTRYAQVQDNEFEAGSFLEGQLLQKGLNTLRSRTSESLNEGDFEQVILERRKASIFTQWLDRTRSVLAQEAVAQQRRQINLQLSVIRRWTVTTDNDRALETRADQFRQRSLLASSFRALRTQSTLRPLFTQVTQRVNARIALSALHTLSQRASQTRLANRVNHERTIRNAFTTWNDQLRILALSVRIDFRIRKELFYQWRIQERYSRFIRERDDRLKRQLLLQWSGRTNINHTARDTASHVFKRTQRTILLNGALTKIRNRLINTHTQERRAVLVQAPRLKAQCLTRWQEKLLHLRDLDSQAEAARFYVLTTHAIKAWKNSTQEHQRQRRRDAYATVRRNYKVGLVQKTFGRWRERATIIQEQTQTAEGKVEDRLLNHTQSLIQRWRDKSQRLQSLEQRATAYRRNKVLQHTFHMLLEKHAHLKSLGTQASELRTEILHVQKDTCLRRLNWRLFELQRLQQSGVSLAERNFKKHVRSMLRNWSEQTIASREARDNTPPDHDNDYGNDDHDNDGGGGGYGVDERQDDYGQDEEDEEDEEDPYLTSPTRRSSGSRGHQSAYGTYTPGREWRSALNASTFDLSRPLDLDFHLDMPGFGQNSTRLGELSAPIFPPPPLHPEPRTREDGQAQQITATPAPLPAYLRTPSKRSTARKARELARERDDVVPGTAARTFTTPGVPPPSRSAPPAYNLPPPTPRHGQHQGVDGGRSVHHPAAGESARRPNGQTSPRKSPQKVQLRSTQRPVLSTAATAPAMAPVSTPVAPELVQPGSIQPVSSFERRLRANGYGGAGRFGASNARHRLYSSARAGGDAAARTSQTPATAPRFGAPGGGGPTAVSFTPAGHPPLGASGIGTPAAGGLRGGLGGQQTPAGQGGFRNSILSTGRGRGTARGKGRTVGFKGFDDIVEASES